MSGGLKEYRAKRDFGRTPEPEGGEAKPGERFACLDGVCVHRVHADTF